jgi:predicted small integral membrane protein
LFFNKFIYLCKIFQSYVIMGLRISTRQMLKILQVLSWVIFIGLCVEAGAIAFNSLYTFVINPANPNKFWEGADLSGLCHNDRENFIGIVLFMVVVTVLKALLFYLILKLFHAKKLNMAQPFNQDLRYFLSNASYLTLGIGLFSYSGGKYSQWLAKQNSGMPDPGSLHLGGADVWLFMAVILMVIVQIVKRGIELQHENDLTI